MQQRRSAIIVGVGFVVAAVLAGCGSENTVSPDYGPATVDVTGEWTGTFTGADTEGNFNFVMTQVGSDVTGFNTRLGRFNGRVTGNVFLVDGTDLYAVVEGNRMVGTYTGEDGEPVEFECERVGPLH